MHVGLGSFQATVLETVRYTKVGRTTIMVTHKLPVIRMCDRILVHHDGKVAEHGTYESITEKKGVIIYKPPGHTRCRFSDDRP